MAQLPQGFNRLPSGSIRWRVSVAGRPASGTAPTLAEARRARAQAALDLGAAPSADRLTVAELLDVWLAEVEHAANTAEVRDRAIAVLPPAFLARRVDAVTPPVLAALWRQMAAGDVGAHTIARARAALSAAWQLGVTYGLAATNPVRAAKFNPPPSRRIQSPAPEQVRLILDRFAARPTLAVWLRLMATIGARPGELCALRWDDFNPARSTIHVGPAVERDGTLGEGKNGRTGWRTVELGLPTSAALRKVERVVGIPWIFQRNGQPWRPEYPGLEFRRACDALGIEGVRLYDLRHFAATQAIGRGVPVPAVAYMLGDNPATVMRVYAHAETDGGAASGTDAALG